jgi:diguanylate cyclase (GGDEF)-like protein
LNTLALIPLITSFFYLVLLVIGLPRAKNKAGTHFIYYLGVAALWSFTSFMLHIDKPPIGTTLFWNEVLVAALVWTLVAYYQFTLVFTERRAGVLLYLSYAALIAVTIFSLTGNIVIYSYVTNGNNHHALFPVANYCLLVAGVSLSAFVISLLVVKYRHSSDLNERNRSMYLFSGWGLLVLFTLSNYINAFTNYPLDQIGNLLNAIVISYAISRYRLLDIKFVARTGLAYIIMAAFVMGGGLGAFLVAKRLFPQTDLTSTALFVSVIFILLLACFRPLLHILQKAIDRIFYRQTYIYRQALQGFSIKMGHILDMNELSRELLSTLCNALETSFAVLFLEKGESGDFSSQFRFPAAQEKQKSILNADSPIVAWLDRNDQPLQPQELDRFPEMQGLWQSERTDIVDSGVQILFPVKSRGRLVCVLALGKKENGRAYSHEDLELVRLMANQAGIIIENAQLYTQATERANTDELTKLYNHRHFHERIEQEIARGSRFGTSFSLLLLDIDLFKSFNDIYGHLAGDQALRKVGQLIVSAIRNIDLAFRYGGEEFAIILPEARIDDGFKVAERIRKTVETGANSLPMPITVSIGVANWPTDGVLKEEIVGKADAALYRAKQNGRNRTCISSELLKPGSTLIGSELESKPTALSIIYALAATVDAKDSYTYGHSRKVSEYAVALGEAMKLSTDKISVLRAAGLLHDIGKIGIPDSILNKTTKLSHEEWEMVLTHPDLGVDILKHVIDLVNCLPAIKHHHEHFDGTGYPSGLKTNSIPLEARILSIADACDAMTSPRPYRPMMSLIDALEELKRCSGSQFDPALVEIFCGLMQSNAQKS